MEDFTKFINGPYGSSCMPYASGEKYTQLLEEISDYLGVDSGEVEFERCQRTWYACVGGERKLKLVNQSSNLVGYKEIVALPYSYMQS